MTNSLHLVAMATLLARLVLFGPVVYQDGRDRSVPALVISNKISSRPLDKRANFISTETFKVWSGIIESSTLWGWCESLGLWFGKPQGPTYYNQYDCADPPRKKMIS